MTVIWLIVWLLKGTTPLQFGAPFSDTAHWNNWAIALCVCIVIDLLGVLKSSS